MTNVVNQFNWGMSQDDNLFALGQSIYSHWFDITKCPWELKLMPPISVVSSVEANWPVASIFSPENTLIWYGTDDWFVRNFSDGATVIDTGGGRQIMDWCLFLGNFYIFSDRYVYKTTYTSGSLGSLSTWYDPWLAEWWHHPVIYQWGEMYFPSGKNVKYTDSTGTIQTLFSTDFSYNVRWLSVQGSNLRIYSEKLLSIVDIGSKTVSYSQVLPFTVTWVTADWDIDYVTTDADEMYACSGLSVSKVAQYDNSDTLWNTDYSSVKFSFKSSQFEKCITSSNWRIYTLDRVTERAMWYGKKMNGLKNAFYYLPIHDNQSIGATVYPIQSFSSVFAMNNKVYLSYKANDIERTGSIDLNDTSNACYEWVYIVPEVHFGDFSMLKQIDEIRVGKTWVGGQLWASINWDDFELVGNLDQTELEQKFTMYKKDFRKIGFMFKLYAINDKIMNLDLRFTNRTV